VWWRRRWSPSGIGCLGRPTAPADLPTGKEFRIADVASGTIKAGGAIPLEFADSHAHFVCAPLTSGGLRA
jgi:hypothetical protein